MNFKLFFFFLPLLFIVGCGVKGPPKALPGTEITPWVQEYINPQEAQNLDSNEQE